MDAPIIQKPIGMIDQLAHVVREEILSGFTAGQKLQSLRTMAHRFGVSPTTMRQALVLLVREGTLLARQGSGYFVAERTAQQHVGIVLQLDFSIPNLSRFWPRVMQGIRRGLRAEGFRSRFYIGEEVPFESGTEGESCRDLDEDIAEDRLLGMIALWGSIGPAIGALRQRAIPLVGNSEWYPVSVSLDYVGLVTEATRRLLDEGRRKLAFMEWGPSELDPRERSRLFYAFAHELALHGATLNECWARSDLHPVSAGAGWEEFREIWTADREKPDGLIVADDMLSLGAAQAIQELGIRVPDQLRVVSHGNKASGLRYPFQVSVLEFDPDEYAQAMVALMVKQLRREPLEQRRIVIASRWADGEETSRGEGVSEYRGVEEHKMDTGGEA